MLQEVTEVDIIINKLNPLYFLKKLFVTSTIVSWYTTNYLKHTGSLEPYLWISKFTGKSIGLVLRQI